MGPEKESDLFGNPIRKPAVPINLARFCRSIDDLMEQLECVDVRTQALGKARDAHEALEVACVSLKSARAFLRRLCNVLGASA